MTHAPDPTPDLAKNDAAPSGGGSGVASRGRTLTVLQLLPALESGGVERGTLEVARALVAAGHRSLVMSAGGRLVQRLRAEGSEHLAWEVGRKSPLTLLRHVRPLRRLLRDEAVDILHIRSRMPGWVAWLAWRGLPPEQRPHLVSTVHGLYSVNAYSGIMVKGERVIAVSSTVRDYILRHYPSTDPARISVIPRGVSAHEFPYGHQPDAAWLADWRARYPRLAGKRVLTLPGRITRLKGHETFIRLIAALKTRGLSVHGLIVGGAEARKQPYLDELQALARQLGLEDDLTFTGHRADMREVMAVSSLVLSLSTQPEAFGRTVLEALYLGVPVAGYEHGGVGEILAAMYPQGRLPLPAPSEQAADALADALQALLADTPKPPPPTRFTLDAMLHATLTLYAETASR